MRTFLAVAVMLLLGCSDPSTHGNVLSNLQQNDGGQDAGGGAGDAGSCTPKSEIANYPVKVLVVVEQSGVMCLLDPPGSQGSSGFCEMADALVADYLDGGLPTEPARVRALKLLAAASQTQGDVQMALQPFEANTLQSFPIGGGFATPNATLDSVVSTLQSTLGKGADMQGALDLAIETLRADMVKTGQSDPATLARTRYVVVVISSGVPYPRCSSDDSLSSYADALHPDGIWADNPTLAAMPSDGGSGGGGGPECLGSDCGGDGGVSICNAACDPNVPGSCLSDILYGLPDGGDAPYPGGDRNQNAQLTGRVDELVSLGGIYGAAQVQLHTALLYDLQPVIWCGVICSDVFTPNNPTDMRTASTWLLQQLAMHGQGTFHDMGSPATPDLSWLDTAPATNLCP
jgi:hypothetical protein